MLTTMKDKLDLFYYENFHEILISKLVGFYCFPFVITNFVTLRLVVNVNTNQ